MKRLFLTWFCLYSFINAFAQLSTNEQPISFIIEQSRYEIDTKEMPKLDMAAIEKEDCESENDNRLVRFGYPHKVSINLINSGTWHTLPSGDKLWQLRIICPDAISINLLYDKFWIPEGGKLFLYTSDRKQSIGAFTSINNKGERKNPKGFATDLLYSDNVIVEYYQPAYVESDAIISISTIVHGYRNIDWSFKKGTRGFGDSEFCQVNVNCSEGDNWQDEKRAVARILVEGTMFATGALVNSATNATTLDYSPLFLTANHAIKQGDYDAISKPNIYGWIFYWNYEASDCSNPPSQPTIYSTAGATVLANNADYADFALLQLTEDPINYNPYYLGWDNSGNSGTGGVCIHHPNGDIKKISTYTMTPISTNRDDTTNINPSGAFWRVRWENTTHGHGITANYSSGSPLLNNSHKVIGQLWGGYSYCAVPYRPDTYGKFSTSWTGNGNSDYRRRLDYWLDPTGTGTQTLNGSYHPTLLISGPNIACSTASYSINNISSSLTVVWELNNSSGISLQQNTPTTNLCTLTGCGTCNLVAKIYRGSSYVTSLFKNNIALSTPDIGMTIQCQTASGVNGCWASNMIGNTFTVEDDKSWAYNSVEAQLYRLDNNFNPSTLVNSWSNISTTNASIPCYTAGWYLFRIRGVNDCGYSNWLEQEVEFVDISMLNFMLDYDASSETLTLTLIEPDSQNFQGIEASSQSTSRGTYEIQLWNGIYSTMTRSYITDLTKYQMSLAGLPSGIYIVRVIIDGKTYSRKFLKK